ncbi:hypothetical protein ILUMI_13886, partial [Ignelater luminosus]
MQGEGGTSANQITATYMKQIQPADLAQRIKYPYPSSQTPQLGNFERQRAILKIKPNPMLGLLDSGSSVKLVGKTGMDIPIGLGLELDTSNIIKCTVADGSTCKTLGKIRTLVCLINKIQISYILMAPNLSELILWMDWMKLSMDVVTNLKVDFWHFGVLKKVSVSGIQAEDALTSEQRDRLKMLSRKKFSQIGKGLGFTNVTEHKITIEHGTRPIKQRYYPVSPFKHKIIDKELDMDMIEPSASAWPYPILLVPKKNKTD